MSINKFRPPPSDTLSIHSDVSMVSKMTRSTTLQVLESKNSSLYNGESVQKSDKILAAIGVLDELIAYIGIIKTEHLDPNREEKFDIESSAKLFLSARLTQIQETLIDIQACIGTSKKINAKYEFTRFSTGEQRIKELENEMQMMEDVELGQIKDGMREKPLQLIPGTTIMECKLMYARAICRRSERHIHQVKNAQIGIVLDDVCACYLNRLSDYFLALSIHLLHMQNKEPLKKSKKTQQSNLK